MPEVNSNIDVAQRILETPPQSTTFGGRPALLESVEAGVLAVVALTTAWSGFQAAKWDGFSAQRSALSVRATVIAQEKLTLAGQERLYDVTTFNGWLQAKALGDDRLCEFYVHRFRPEYAVAFAAWQKLDPFNNSSAAPGAVFMPEYVNANARESARLMEEARGRFEESVNARETGDRFVKTTVLLATVLLLTAIGQRFRAHRLRAVMIVVASVLLGISSYQALTLPYIW